MGEKVVLILANKLERLSNPGKSVYMISEQIVKTTKNMNEKIGL